MGTFPGRTAPFERGRRGLRGRREPALEINRPLADTLKGSRHANLKELRVQSNRRPFRVLYAFDPRRHAILLVGGNKEGRPRFYDELIPLADPVI